MHKDVNFCQVCWHTSIIPELAEWEQEDHEFEVILGYKVSTSQNKQKPPN
jgi:hypothetical protein